MRKLQTHTSVAILKCVPKGPNSQASTQTRIKEIMWFSSAFQVSGQDLQNQFPQNHKGQWKDLLEVLHQANQAA